MGWALLYIFVAFGRASSVVVIWDKKWSKGWMEMA